MRLLVPLEALISLFEMARNASERESPTLRFSALMLLAALDDLMRYMGPAWLGTDGTATTAELLAACSADHLHDTAGSDSPHSARVTHP